MNLIPRNQVATIDSLFDDFFTGYPLLVGKQAFSDSVMGMRVDIHETDKQFEIVADLPGVKKEDISVTLEDDVLTVAASTLTESEEKKRGKVIRRERRSGSYSRSFSVGAGVKKSDIKASFADGVLTLAVPKMTQDEKQSSVKKISIK